MKRFMMTLRFMTRLPAPCGDEFDEEFYKATVFFPLVGLVVGILAYAASWIITLVLMSALNVGLSALYRDVEVLVRADIFASSFVTTEILITGALHMDGFGDVFDAIFSYAQKDKMLEIMKDPRAGTGSVLSMLLLVINKFLLIALFSICKLTPLLIVTPMIARLSPVILCYKTESPRKNGMGNIFIGSVKKETLILATAYTAAASIAIMLIARLVLKGQFAAAILPILMISFILILTVIIISKIYIGYFNRKIGGITGDVLGFSVELSEYLLILTGSLLIYLGG